MCTYIHMYIYIYTYVCIYIYIYTYIHVGVGARDFNLDSSRRGSPRIVAFVKLLMARKLAVRSILIISIHTISNLWSRIPEPLLISTSKYPLKVQISQGLGTLFQVELLKTGRTAWGRGGPLTGHALLSRTSLARNNSNYI